jgi:hypothetical protein
MSLQLERGFSDKVSTSHDKSPPCTTSLCLTRGVSSSPLTTSRLHEQSPPPTKTQTWHHPGAQASPQ